MFLLDFSLYFFKVNASTKLDFFFFNAQDLTLGEEKEYSQIPICISFIWVFLALDPPLWPSVYVLQAPGPAAASVTLSLLLWVVQLLWFHS